MLVSVFDLNDKTSITLLSDDKNTDFCYTPSMTPETLLREWLSLRYWLLRCVLPVAIALAVMLVVMRFIFTDPQSLNHNSLIVAFFCMYFITVRGGHIVMIRSMHFDLLKTYGDDYRSELTYLQPGQMKRRNIGFTLARIKRDLLHAKKKN